MLIKTAIGTVVIFLLFSLWGFLAWSAGNKTKSWDATPAKVIKNDMKKSINNRPRGWETTVVYTVNELKYEAIVDEYLTGDTTVYVHPENPTLVVGKQGPTIQTMGIPLLGMGVSALLCLVLLMIAFSPKEDD